MQFHLFLLDHSISHGDHPRSGYGYGRGGYDDIRAGFNNFQNYRANFLQNPYSGQQQQPNAAAQQTQRSVQPPRLQLQITAGNVSASQYQSRSGWQPQRNTTAAYYGADQGAHEDQPPSHDEQASYQCEGSTEQSLHEAPEQAYRGNYENYYGEASEPPPGFGESDFDADVYHASTSVRRPDPISEPVAQLTMPRSKKQPIKCKRCKSEFTSNNKLHKYI